MNFVKNVSSENFSFEVSSDGLSVTIKPKTKDAKGLFRFKKLGKGFEAKADGNTIFELVAQYELKLDALKKI
jgi:hypothetical protein